MPIKILIVDDEPDLEQLIRQRFRKKIQTTEFEFFSAFNGLEALQILQNGQEIDIILTDINMPKMDGLTLLENIRALNNPFLKSIVVSAYGDMENIRAAMNHGAFDFVTKPISLEDLEKTINKTIHELDFIKKALENQNAYYALQQELNIARDIQLSILPQSIPLELEQPGYEIAASMETANEVGGDFYDYFKIDDNHIGFLIGDVAGKGVPAAIFMAVCKTTLKATALNGQSTAECLTTANNILVHESICDVFVTAFYGILNIRNGELEYCNAGHNAPLLITHQAIKALEVGNGIPLGFLENFHYSGQIIQLKDKDTIFLYTDGITEAMDSQQKEFSEHQLYQALNKHRKKSLWKMNEGILEEVQIHSHNLLPGDDMTVFSLRYREQN